MTERNLRSAEYTDKLRKLLGDERMKTVICLESTGSTNLYLKDLAAESGTFGEKKPVAAEGTVVIAGEQTKGRGRLGRSFESPKDKGIYLSCLLRPDISPDEAVKITARTAVCVCRAVQKACNVLPGIKWVNDLILSGRKFCGILAEMQIDANTGRISEIIIGIGVNVNEEKKDFSESIRNKATSLRLEIGKIQDRAVIASEIIKELDGIGDFSPKAEEGFLKAYREYCILKGREVYVRKTEDIPGDTVDTEDPSDGGKNRRATVLGINNDFSLMVRYDDGSVEDLNTGEVSIRGLNGYL
ncbi:MAG: biotin--[acetyl-CoA-carboxylase] ligase [Lachnospiraceae bacterium]|nr:biotin--[acetyl-CoA-carboxylase] ligase [Lachnospiraceae bacterium]